MDHPTAAEIYEAARRELPQISLGTVYRNLGQLVNRGDLKSFRVGERVHYDISTQAHQHFVCRQCGRVIDLAGEPALELQRAAEAMGHRVEQLEFLLSGLCHECISHQSQ